MPKNDEVKRRLRAKFLALQQQKGKNLQSWPDKKSQLQQSSKPIASGSDQKKVERNQASKIPAKRALDWEPMFAIEEDLPKYKRVVIKDVETENDVVPSETKEATQLLAEAMFVREKYMAMSLQQTCETTRKALNEIDEEFNVDIVLKKRDVKAERLKGESKKQKKIENFYDQIVLPEACDYKFENRDGVYCITAGTPLVTGSVFFNKDGTPKGQIAPSKDEFLSDYYLLLATCANGPVRSLATRQLEYLEGKFNLHVLMNSNKELAEIKQVPKRDYYNVRKVDTHIHATACMSQFSLLKFMRRKAKKCPDDIVAEKDGKKITLIQFFQSLGLSPNDLSVDSLDVHAGEETFNRFDNFNKKYNPAGQGALRKLFLKKANYMDGQYLAEQIKDVMTLHEKHKYVNSELRISVHGKYPDEWLRLAQWALKYNIQSPNVRWMIQVPRLFDIYCKRGNYKSFAEMLQYLFGPMFDATLDPKSHPEIAKFMTQVIGFDSVDDESIPELTPFNEDSETPSNWTKAERPTEREMNTFVLRPHCGEAGSPKHLVAGFMLTQNISHGLMLRKSPTLQYLYYLNQIAVAMSPLSNNSLFLNYNQNPFPEFFAKGLNVTLSTDDPLIFHYTEQPLIEEYSIAAQVFKLSGTDISEIAKNSVLMCGFEDEYKRHWLGKDYDKEGLAGNEISKSNVPSTRAAYRYETLVQELTYICRIVKNSAADDDD